VIVGRWLLSFYKFVGVVTWAVLFVGTTWSLLSIFKVDIAPWTKDTFLTSLISTLLGGVLALLGGIYQSRKNREAGLDEIRYEKLLIPLYKSAQLLSDDVKRGKYEVLKKRLMNSVDGIELEFRMNPLFIYHLGILEVNEKRAIECCRAVVGLLDRLRFSKLPTGVQRDQVGSSPGKTMEMLIYGKGSYFDYEGDRDVAIDLAQINRELHQEVRRSVEYRQFLVAHYRLESVSISLFRYLRYEIHKFIDLKF